MGSVLAQQDSEATIVYNQSVELCQMERTGRCDKAITANVKKDGQVSIAMSVPRIRLVMP